MADVIIERLNRIARQQRGLITRAQALACRPDRRADHRPIAQRHLAPPASRRVRDRSGATVVGAVPACDHPLRCRASRLTGPPASCSGCRGFDQPERIEVVSTFEQFVRLDGVRGHRSRSLFDVDKSHRLGIPTVTAERALIDVSGMLTTKQVGAGARRRDPPQGCRPRVVPTLRRAADAQAGTIDAPSPTTCWPNDSPATTRATATSRLVRFVCSSPPASHRPASSSALKLRGKNVRIDLAYPEQRIAIELDSWEFHGEGNRTAFTCRPGDGATICS